MTGLEDRCSSVVCESVRCLVTGVGSFLSFFAVSEFADDGKMSVRAIHQVSITGSRETIVTSK